ESGMSTRALVPLKDRAPPYLPAVVQVAPLMVPLFPEPELSVTVVPLPSLKPRARTRPLGAALETVTVTVAEVVVFPLVSRARALRTWVPFATVPVSQVIEYGATVSSAPKLLPSRRNCTPATATSSEAVAVTVITPETVAPAAGLVTVTEGGLVSAVAVAPAS